MRTAILYGLLVFMMLQRAEAQKIHFTDTSNHWFTQGKDPLDTPFQGDYYYEPAFDQTFNGQKYFALFANLMTWGGGASYFFYIREDTTARKVYLWSVPDAKEVVLYDYNLRTGDTIHFYNYANPPFIDSVLSVDSILINGAYHKIFSLYEIEPFYHIANRYYTYVEGLGSVNEPLQQRFFQHFGSRELLSCFRNNDTAYPVTIAFKDSFNTKTLLFTNSCSAVSTGQVAKAGLDVCVRPNPVTGDTRVFFSQAPVSGNLSITNSIGQQIVNISFYDKKSIPVGEKVTDPGCYYYTINLAGYDGSYRGILIKQ